MKIIRNKRGLAAARGGVVTLGNFDGVHLGHRKILTRVVARARKLGVPSVLFTFDPHPMKVVAPLKSPPLLADFEGKADSVASIGVDYMVVAGFTKAFGARHPREFVEEEIVKSLDAREVWVGHDYAFGRGKGGTVDYLKGLGKTLDFKVKVVPAIRKRGGVVSSSRIRGLVKEGDVAEAGRLLGSDYTIKGKVVKGSAVGRRLGFPTANLDVTSELTPGTGVYAAWAHMGGKKHKAAVNIGKAPTVAKGKKKVTVEAHLIGYKGRLYGRRLSLSFVRRLRSEKKFSSEAALTAQIEADIKRSRKILG